MVHFTAPSDNVTTSCFPKKHKHLKRAAVPIFIGIIVLVKTVLKSNERQNWPIINAANALIKENNHSLVLRDMLVDWQSVLAPCWSSMNYSATLPTDETDTSSSYISAWNIQGVGYLSWFTLQTQTRSGEPLYRGGDAWSVESVGDLSLFVIVKDHNNGSYSFYFIPQFSGEYRLILTLEYSRCGGHMDPPKNYFASGNIHGSNQRQGILGQIGRAYQHTVLWEGTPVVIYIKDSTTEASDILLAKLQGVSIPLYPLSSECYYLLEPLGTWKSDKWISLRGLRNKDILPIRSRRSWLWIYGDSLALRLHASLVRDPLCTTVFQCNRTYNWVYRFGSYADKFKLGNKSFEAERVLQELGEVLKQDIMDKDSVIIINFGLHFVSSLSFKEYQDFIRKLLAFIKSLKTVGYFNGTVIWKTTTYYRQEKLLNPYHDARRFLTSIRVQLFNAFATSAMCSSGIPIVDVYPLSASYPGGTESRHDGLHYEAKVFRPLIDRLVASFTRDK